MIQQPRGRRHLRPLQVPISLIPTFLRIASSHTQRGIEMCGLLLEEESGELEVRALLIPRQEGTSDTCTMKEEERVVGVQLERGLIALGWIHTHPTQSCFMSSMDLHTHSAYQQTLPEAIAIVCAPRSDPAFGIFRLTEPAGLMTVLQCKRRQTFHEHPRISGGLYTDADHGGHVLLNERGRGIEVIDLRR
ncbi:hypothetical protein FFLO_05948 [Filobasidium floriforme]|uniref:MPN domain-containing protein n=1 Tax=Filobasidium floriforme TaxID=5210 RepID=A0A8K0NNH6_9TREE|nr:uncharacterized protein HD553DRAFT_271179 [Filobasidium floriforme]KAG7528779.1 hypothetical protein FFLO_05948 [Filobasidium floriforme]KAH8085802.1 hypothetical protein HD553DRAFT_271179 [Filobasidium floriforme]